MSDSQTHSPFAHKKSLGQNFLTSDVVPKWLCEAANLPAGELVLEIGPGTGILTKELLARGFKVVAVEADVRAVSYLKEHFKEVCTLGQLTIHQLDVRSLDLTNLGFSDKKFAVVANIPYYLSGFLLRNLLETSIQPHTLVFLMQKELVARIAKDKKESLLSLSVKAYGNPTYIRTVSRGHFNPSPKVDSAILTIKNIHRDRLQGLATDFFFSILHLGLGNKRKQLVGNLSQVFDRERVLSIFQTIGLDLAIRGEDVSLESWIKLTSKLQTLN